MIYSLCGKLSHVEDGMFVVECSGVGFACKASATAISCLPPEGSEVFVYTTMTFSAEQGTDLYGFYEKAEQECFSMLTGISGIGPKAALSVLSEFTPDSFALAVASGDAKAITRAKGIGPKAAQRIILELHDKISGNSAAKGFSARRQYSRRGGRSHRRAGKPRLYQCRSRRGYREASAGLARGRNDKACA